MKEENIPKIRAARRDDSKGIWELRNHPSARKQSGNPEEIPFESHKIWFENKYFKGGDNFCFVLEYNNRAVGYCRYDLGNYDSGIYDSSGDDYIVSVAIDSKERGKGFGNTLLSESLKKLATQKNILAKIKKSNHPSLKLFKRNYFELYKEDGENCFLKYKIPNITINL